jgi:hypothetical protein
VGGGGRAAEAAELARNPRGFVVRFPDSGVCTSNNPERIHHNMKKLSLIVAGLCLLGLLAPGAFAAKGDKAAKKNKAPQTVPSDVYAKYDKNYNGILDTDEKDALRTELANDAALKAYDTNNDGKLSDDEIAAIPATKAVDAPVKEKKKKNK